MVGALEKFSRDGDARAKVSSCMVSQMAVWWGFARFLFLHHCGLQPPHGYLKLRWQQSLRNVSALLPHF